jgi:hypothetical protein
MARCQATADRAAARRGARLLQRRLAPPRALRRTSFGRNARTPVGPDLGCTGLPPHSALVAPPLRLAARRWLETLVILVRPRPPPGVSTAFLVAGARFFGTPFPGVPPLRMCPRVLEASAAHSQGRHTRPVREGSCSAGHVIFGSCGARGGSRHPRRRPSSHPEATPTQVSAGRNTLIRYTLGRYAWVGWRFRASLALRSRCSSSTGQCLEGPGGGRQTDRPEEARHD